MATIALIAVAAKATTAGTVAAAVWSGVAAAVGGYLDSAFVFPALFGVPEVEGAKLNDLQLMLTAEGSPLPIVLGVGMRAPCTPIWSTPIVETSNTTSGGKGGPDYTTYTYTVDLALSLSDVEHYGNTVELNRLFADGQIVYRKNPVVVETSTQLKMVSVPYTFCVPVVPNPLCFTRYRGRITTVAPFSTAPELEATFITGAPLVVTGFSNAANNKTWTVRDVGTDASGQSYIEVQYGDGKSAAQAPVTEAAGNSVTLSQDQGNIVNETFVEVDVTHTGDFNNETPDSYIESFEGTGNVPGYRGTSYIVLRSLNITKFGNRIPSFTAEVTPSVAGVGDVTHFLLRKAGVEQHPGKGTGTGLLAKYIDANAVPNENVRGALQLGPQPVGTLLSQVLVGLNLVAREEDGKIRYLRRDGEINETAPDGYAKYYRERVIDPTDLAAASIGENRARPFTVTELSDDELPGAVSVNFRDEDEGYSQGNETVSSPTRPSSVETTIGLANLALDKDRAFKLATYSLWQAILNREQVTMSLPLNYADLVPHDIVTVEAFDRTWRLMVRSVDILEDRVTVEALYEDENVYRFTPTTEAAALASTINAADEGYTPEPELIPFELYDEESPGLLLAGASLPYSRSFSPFAVFDSLDDGTTYEQLAIVRAGSTVGKTLTQLGSAPHQYFDYVSTVEVQLYSGTLSSTTEENVLNGKNWARIGNEVVGFVTATSIDTNTYRLSGLLRGRYATEARVGDHETREPFVLLDGTHTTVPFGHDAVGRSRTLKAIADGRAAADQENTLPYEYVSAADVPHPPTGFAGTRDGSNNLTITWERRTRARVKLLTGRPIAQPERGEAYEVDIYDDAAYSNVVRTVETSSKTATYTAANQTADGLTPGNTVYFKAYQTNDIIGRGLPFTGSV